ncbi:MAG: DUF4160 domain-containing protein [Fibrobacter sp.]|nr:DUF4160 domain-containing protein [Fibrobacter sp.]
MFRSPTGKTGAGGKPVGRGAHGSAPHGPRLASCSRQTKETALSGVVFFVGGFLEIMFRFPNLFIFAKKYHVMPQISSFYGIVIFMNFTDHSPAHFHAWYGEYKVTVGIRDGVVTGKMPGRALRMVLEWLDLHRDELISNWEKAQNGTPLDKIEPLN